MSRSRIESLDRRVLMAASATQLQAFESLGLEAQEAPLAPMPTLSPAQTNFQNVQYGLMFHFFPALTAGATGLPAATAAGGIDGVTSYSAAATATVTMPSNHPGYTPGAKESPWSSAVADFNVTNFRDGVVATGARYVIFSVGQNTGYMCSPNQSFNNSTNNATGEFTSHRDLINDIALALAPVGVKMFVYFGADMASAAVPNYRVTSNNSLISRQRNSAGMATNFADPQFGLQYGAFNADNRDRTAAVINEYSLRWNGQNGKGKVDGWWIDGAFSGLWNNSLNDPDLNILIAACKAGNASAVVAANPSAADRGVLTEAQDFIAGEARPLTEANNMPTEILDRYPKWDRNNPKSGGEVFQPNVSTTKSFQWHHMTYVGNAEWASTGARFTASQIANYTYHVAQSGGVVSYDLLVNKSGTINATQVGRFASTKTSFGSALAPLAVPTAPALQTGEHLAQWKPTYLFNNGTNSKTNYNTSNELTPSGETRAGAFAVDGSTSAGTFGNNVAVAGGSYAYTLEVQFRKFQDINRVQLTMPTTSGSFASEFKIEVYGGDIWRSVAATWGNAAGGTLTLNFPRALCEGLRLVVLEPSANTQALITELAVYNVATHSTTTEGLQISTENVAVGLPAVGKTASFYENTLSTQLGASINNQTGVAQVAGYGIDGDLDTYAQAGGSYAYTFIAGLTNTPSQGFNAAKIEIVPARGLYTTSYQIWIHRYVPNGNGTREWVRYTRNNVTTYSRSDDKPFSHVLYSANTGTSIGVDVDQIAIMSLSPDNQGQPGVQMSVADLRVYPKKTTSNRPAQQQLVSEPVVGFVSERHATDGIFADLDLAEVSWAADRPGAKRRQAEALLPAVGLI